MVKNLKGDHLLHLDGGVFPITSLEAVNPNGKNPRLNIRAEFKWPDIPFLTNASRSPDAVELIPIDNGLNIVSLKNPILKHGYYSAVCNRSGIGSIELDFLCSSLERVS